jgi:hypothetical protein
MKLKRTSDGKIEITRRAWEEMGREAGWWHEEPFSEDVRQQIVEETGRPHTSSIQNRVAVLQLIREMAEKYPMALPTLLGMSMQEFCDRVENNKVNLPENIIDDLGV